tara:strand:- start:117 stop:341 length:225 start_codon:yes stop_codon:yes gene_type:complete
MRYSKEFLYHFRCEKCLNWWTHSTIDELEELFHKTKNWYCPHCSYKHMPPHKNKDDTSGASDEFLDAFREGGKI